MIKENFHTHTYYCDGKYSPEEMTNAAIDKGFSALGFSGHAYIKDFPCDWCMSVKNTQKYINEITALKAEKADNIDIYCGTELDYYCTEIPGKYDFTIGSVHYIKRENDYLPIDLNSESQINAANKYFDGSLIKYSVAYYQIVADLMNKFNADIIGHFDLVTKFNDKDAAFDTQNKKYVEAWHNAVDALIPYNKPFEINTGAIARGYRTAPYPALDIADYINSKGGYFILTSDCHDYHYLDCCFEDALKMYSKYNIVSFRDLINTRK